MSRLRAHGFDVVSCPFSDVPVRQENAVWISPLVCTVEYMPSGKEGMRQLVFKGIRDDKDEWGM